MEEKDKKVLTEQDRVNITNEALRILDLMDDSESDSYILFRGHYDGRKEEVYESEDGKVCATGKHGGYSQCAISGTMPNLIDAMVRACLPHPKNEGADGMRALIMSAAVTLIVNSDEPHTELLKFTSSVAQSMTEFQRHIRKRRDEQNE